MPRKPSVKTKENEAVADDSLVELKSQFDRWIADQDQRDLYLQEQLEHQSEMFLRIESRLNQISEQVIQLTLGALDEQTIAPASPVSLPAVASANIDTSVFSSWHSQREQMLAALSTESETASRAPKPRPVEPVPKAKPELKIPLNFEPPAAESSALAHATAEDLVEIEGLKAQLQEALRETEIELSIQRAKLSQERQRLEEFESALNQRERSISRQNLNSSRKQDDGIVKRLKGFLNLGQDKKE